MAEIILHPAGSGRYHAVWSGAVIATSSAAITAGARALLELGVDPDEELTARHHGSDIVSMRGTVGGFAKLTVKEGAKDGPRLVPWTPYPTDAHAPPPGESQDGRSGASPYPTSRDTFPAAGEETFA